MFFFSSATLLDDVNLDVKLLFFLFKCFLQFLSIQQFCLNGTLSYSW